MGLTMSQRRAVTKTIGTRYKRADKAAKGMILDELCATTGWAPQPRPQGAGRGVETQDREVGTEGPCPEV